MFPLKGMRVVEMVGVGPAPFCGMLLADMGADVVRIDRQGPSGLGVAFPPEFDFLNRGKTLATLDLKSAAGEAKAREMIASADAVIEGFRPGVMEKLGLGPAVFAELNPKLVYGRMTGWGQSGPLARAAGHDINYVAVTGALDAIGRRGGLPTVPLNLVGDFGGGALYLAMGVLAAVLSARDTGKGCVVDAAIVDGVTNLMTMHYGLLQMGQWRNGRGENLIDGGAPFYDVYETADGKYVSIGAIEAKFFGTLMDILGVDRSELPSQYDETGWPELRGKLGSVFASQTQKHWCELLEGTDACFAPVLTVDEAHAHPHILARASVLERDGVRQPAAAPRFIRLG